MSDEKWKAEKRTISRDDLKIMYGFSDSALRALFSKDGPSWDDFITGVDVVHDGKKYKLWASEVAPVGEWPNYDLKYQWNGGYDGFCRVPVYAKPKPPLPDYVTVTDCGSWT